MAKKKHTVWLVWDAENSILQGVHADKKDAEHRIAELVRQPGHNADKLHPVEAPSRH